MNDYKVILNKVKGVREITRYPPRGYILRLVNLASDARSENTGELADLNYLLPYLPIYFDKIYTWCGIEGVDLTTGDVVYHVIFSLG